MYGFITATTGFFKHFNEKAKIFGRAFNVIRTCLRLAKKSHLLSENRKYFWICLDKISFLLRTTRTT